MIALPRLHDAVETEREPFQRVSRREPCAICERPDWCMVNSTTAMCMRIQQGCYHVGRNKLGEEFYLHRRTGAAPPPRPPRRDAPADWTRPAPVTCATLYHDLLATMTRPAPPEARAADARRFGEHAAAVAAVEDAVYFRPPAEVLAWLRANHRIPDALAAGVVYRDEDGKDRLAGALVASKVHVYRERGQVRNLKGRKLDPDAKVKALSLYRTREERGCPHALYQHDDLDRATDGLLVIAGGAAKVDACRAAGLHAAGGEETLSDAQIAAIAAARPAGIVVVADGEPAKVPGELSPGQRHALAMAERLEELGGQAVKIAEPTREPGNPKVDADSLLRDHGPEALRELVRAALPLALYRRKIGADLEVTPPALLEELRAQIRVLREENARFRENSAATSAALENVPYRKEARGAIGLVKVWQEHRERDDSFVDPKDGKRFVHVPMWKAGACVGYSDDTAGTIATTLAKDGLIEKQVKRVPEKRKDPQTGEEREQLVSRVYVHIPDPTPAAFLRRVAAFDPAKPPERRHGGFRPARECATHPGAPVKVTTAKVTTCAPCDAEGRETILERVLINEQYFDGQGAPVEPGEALRLVADYTPPPAEDDDPTPAMPDLFAPGDFHAGVKVDGPETSPPAPIDLAAHRPPRCMHCGERMPAGDAQRYCPRCRADGWHDPRPPAAASGGAGPPGGESLGAGG